MILRQDVLFVVLLAYRESVHLFHQHLGATGTGYGIYGSGAMKFEDSMWKAVQGPIEQQPDPLFQLVPY